MTELINQLPNALAVYKEDATDASFPKLLGRISFMAGIDGQTEDERWNKTIDFLDDNHHGWRGHDT